MARRRSSACRPTGFPNLFFPGGPHAAAGNNPRYNGDQVDFITDTLVHARDHGYDVIEVDADGRGAVDRAWSTGRASKTPFGTIGQYVGGNIPGKPKRYLLNAGGRPKLFSHDRGSRRATTTNAVSGCRARSDGRDGRHR